MGQLIKYALGKRNFTGDLIEIQNMVNGGVSMGEMRCRQKY